MSDTPAATAPILPLDVVRQQLVPGGVLMRPDAATPNPISPNLSQAASAGSFRAPDVSLPNVSLPNISLPPPLPPRSPFPPATVSAQKKATPATVSTQKKATTATAPLPAQESPNAVGFDPIIIRAQTVQYWQGQGVPRHVAEGIADALQLESGFNPGAYNANDNGAPSGGLYQHHGDRLQRLQQFAQQQGKPWTDPMVQHQFMNWERQGGDPIVTQHWPEIISAPDRPTAKALWQKYVERGVLQSGTGSTNNNLADKEEYRRSTETVKNSLYGEANNLSARAQDALKEFKDFKSGIPAAMERIHAARDLSDQAAKKAEEYIKQQPHQPDIDGIKQLGSLATIIGMIGGLLTRSPMTAALNAGASAIEAANAGDMDRYTLAFNQWKTNNDMLFKIADMQARRADDISKDEKMGLDEKSRALDIYFRAVGLEKLADEMRIKGADVVNDFTKTVFNATEKQEAIRERILAQHERMIAQQLEKDPVKKYVYEQEQKYKAENTNPDGTPKEPTPQMQSDWYKEGQELYPKQRTGVEADKYERYTGAKKDLTETWQSEHPDEEMSAADRESIEDQAMIKSGRMPPGTAKMLQDPKAAAFRQFVAEHGGKATSQEMTAFIRSQTPARSPRSAMLQAYMNAYPNATPEQLQGWYAGQIMVEAAARYFAAGRGGELLGSFTAVADHLEVFKDLAAAYRGGKNKIIREAQAQFETVIGKAAPNNLKLAQIILGDEIARAVIGGVGALADRKAIQEPLSRANSWEQVEGVIDTAERFVAGQLGRLENHWVRSGMGLKEPFENQLSPAARKLFSSVPKTGGLTYGGHADAPKQTDAPKDSAKQWPTPTPEHIKMLKEHPELRDKFDAPDAYGPGAAEKILGR